MPTVLDVVQFVYMMYVSLIRQLVLMVSVFLTLFINIYLLQVICTCHCTCHDFNIQLLTEFKDNSSFV